MSGTMSKSDLVADLKASLNDASAVFTAVDDADFKRHLALAALAFGRIRPRTLVGSLTLVADQPEYTVPADFVAYKSSMWGIAPIARSQPWEKSWPGRLPDVRYVEQSGTNKLYLQPPPTSAQITALGAEFRFYYYAGHVIGDTAAATTILAAERGRLLLRAQAEAMRELTIRGVKKPVALRDGVTGVARNSTPAALYQALLDEFEASAA